MNIIELKIDDLLEEAGVDGIALVQRPAIEEDWYWFSQDKLYIVEKDQIDKLEEVINNYGTPVSELEEQGWVITSVEDVNEEDFLRENPCQSGYIAYGTKIKDGQEVPNCVPIENSKEEFAGEFYVSNPNELSALDGADPNTGQIVRVRYKYVGPQDSKNRDFCAMMMSANRVYRIEDIAEMTSSLANPEFGQYDIFQYRGSYNCRHRWIKIVYKTEGKIINKANSRRGVIGTEDFPQESTLNEKTASKQQGELGVQFNEDFRPIEIVDGLPVYETPEQAAYIAQRAGCEGYHEHLLDGGKVGYMPCSEHPKQEDFDSYDDYPQYISDAAQEAYDWIEENGNPNDCMTPVGRARLTQLRKREKISIETMKRMKSYISRHLVDLESSTSYEEGCGKLAMASWGCRTKDECESAINYLDRKISSVENKELLSNTNKFNRVKLNLDEEKRIVTGPAMIPNKMIPRQGPNGVYSVFFSEETIRKIAEKFMRNKYTDKTNLEHTPINLSDVYVIESWIIDNPESDKSTKFGYNLPEGTWMVSMKVDNDKVWNSVKQGNIKGFSVEGYFVEQLVFNKEDQLVQEIITILNNTDDE